MEMTMRQVFGFLRIIHRADLVEFYNQLLSYGTVHGAKLCSLEEFLNLTSGKEHTAPKSFDENTDKVLEAEALKRFAERQKQYGK
jgi:hypothetical protein